MYQRFLGSSFCVLTNSAMLFGFQTFCVMAAHLEQPGTTCSLFREWLSNTGRGGYKTGGGGPVKFNPYKRGRGQ